MPAEHISTKAGAIPPSSNTTLNAKSYGNLSLSGGLRLGSTGSLANTIINSGSTASSYQVGYYGHTLAFVPAWNIGNQNALALSQPTWGAPSAANITYNLLEFPGTLNGTSGNTSTLRGLHTVLTDSGTLANTLIGVYSDVSSGTNSSATRYAGLFMGGNVGIGTTSPGAQLEADIASASNVGLIVKDAASQSSPAIQYLRSDGNKMVELKRSADAASGVISLYASNAGETKLYGNNALYVDTGQTAQLRLLPSGNDVYLQNTLTSGNIYFTGNSGASLTGNVIFKTSGNVGIGTTSPAYLLHVGSSSASDIVVEFQNSSGACTHNPASGTEIVSCSSDARLKTNIRNSGDALEWLGNMRIRDFTVRSTGEARTGVVAQEMQPLHPDMVHKGPDGLYKVEQPNPWKLIKAIQELKALFGADHDEIAKLKAANDNQAAEMARLKADNDNEKAEIKALQAEFRAYKAAHP